MSLEIQSRRQSDPSFKTVPKVSPAPNHEEQQYLDLIKTILEEGDEAPSRSGSTLSTFGTTMTFSLKDGKIPILTTKKVALKTCIKELLWFIRGHTNNALLQKQKVYIWNANASKEFLASRNLDYEENDLGPVYGHQWRHFNAAYKDCNTDYSGQGVDQLEYIIKSLLDPKERYSRRLLMSAWNPCQIDQMALPPCHVLAQFHVCSKNTLSCALYQRSGDVGLGVPFNITSYSVLTHLLAHHCGLTPGKFVHVIGNAHIYLNHKEALQEQCKRVPYAFPSIRICPTQPTQPTQRNKIEDYILEDIVIENYQCHPPLTMEMIA
tara:strand:+ start:276 stop:1241 length:966 start_codon:yes stop_codon:yes gene_type:complete